MKNNNDLLFLCKLLIIAWIFLENKGRVNDD